MNGEYKKYKEKIRRRVKNEIYRKRKKTSEIEKKYDEIYNKIFGYNYLELFSVFNLSIDHKYSIYSGFKNSIPYNILCCPYNLEIMDKNVNEKKGSRCSITLTKLIKLYQQFIKEYPELNFSRKEDIEYIERMSKNKSIKKKKYLNKNNYQRNKYE